MARSEAVSVGACSAPAREARGGLTVTAPEARTIWAGRGVVRRHGFRATARRPEPHRRSPADAREPNPPLLGPHLRAAGERTVARRATARPSLVDDLARSLRALRDCYRDTANPRLRRALL